MPLASQSTPILKLRALRLGLVIRSQASSTTTETAVSQQQSEHHSIDDLDKPKGESAHSGKSIKPVQNARPKDKSRGGALPHHSKGGQRSAEVRRAQGFPVLMNNFAVQRAAGFPELLKIVALERAAGFPKLAKGRDTMVKEHGEMFVVRPLSGYRDLKRKVALAERKKADPIKYAILKAKRREMRVKSLQARGLADASLRPQDLPDSSDDETQADYRVKHKEMWTLKRDQVRKKWGRGPFQEKDNSEDDYSDGGPNRSDDESVVS